MIRFGDQLTDEQLLQALAEVARAEEATRQVDAAETPAYTFVDDAVRARFAKAVLAALPAQRTEPEAEVESELIRARSRHEKSSSAQWLRAVAWTMPALAAAAAAALYFGGTDRAPLPNYSFQVSGFEAEMRADHEPLRSPSEGPLTLGPSTSLVAVLRPETTVAGEVAVRSYFVQAGRATPWEADVETAASGGLRLRLSPPWTKWSGEAELVVWVGRPEVVERPYPELVPGSDAQHWRQPVLVRARP